MIAHVPLAEQAVFLFYLRDKIYYMTNIENDCKIPVLQY